MASKVKNVELLRGIFGDRTDYILNKIEKDKIKITNRSSNFVINLSNLLFNYIDFIHDGNPTVIENKNVEEIQYEYDKWIEEKKLTYSFFNKHENEEIIFDYRINDVGYYWVDLKSNHSSEMIFNMNNCGRVGVNQNIIVLREQKESGENLMRVAISISKDHHIFQIKGKGDGKPIQYYTQIFDLLLRYEPIVGFKRIYKPEDDFTINDLKDEDVQKLKLVKPHLFNKFI
jgi:hypothetical protein